MTHINRTRTPLATLALALSLALPLVAARGDDADRDRDRDDDREHEVESADDHRGGGGASTGGGAPAASSRVANDLRVRLRVKNRRGDRLRVRVRVKNRGRDRGGPATVALTTDAGDVLWSRSVSLRPGERFRETLRMDRPADAAGLTCRADFDDVDDDRPEDNEDREPIGGSGTAFDAASGAAVWIPQCSSCHGADGRGGSVRENVSRESWREIYESFDEGEDGMPRFTSLTTRDAKNVYAYLRDPTGVAPTPDPTPDPAPDPTPDPVPTSTTYTADIAPVLAAQCTSCHGPSFAAAGIRLDGYDNARSGAQAALTSIQAGRMPPSGSFPAADRQKLADWIATGFTR